MTKGKIDSPAEAKEFIRGVLEDLATQPAAKLHPYYQQIDNLHFAAFLVWQGYRLVRVTSDLSGRATFGLLVPAAEFEEAEEAWSDHSIAIENPRRLCQSVDLVRARIKRSKQNGGIWSDKIA
jgi:hypothetical protein